MGRQTVCFAAMLAYVFWHRLREGVEAARYEESLRRFHDSLDVPSASFRLLELPFAKMDGYEDWYLVEDWHALGALNADAVDDLRRDTHHTVTRWRGLGWGLRAHARHGRTASRRPLAREAARSLV